MARATAHPTKPNPEKNPRRDPTAAGQRDAAVNRVASHNYFLLEKFETGVALTGTEVKSVRAGQANLKDSYGLLKDGELWLLNCHIGTVRPRQHLQPRAPAHPQTAGPQGGNPQAHRQDPAEGPDPHPHADVLQER